MNAQEAARRIAEVFAEVEAAGFDLSGHWSGDLLIHRLGLDPFDTAVVFAPDNYAGLSFEDSGGSGHWRQYLGLVV